MRYALNFVAAVHLLFALIAVWAPDSAFTAPPEPERRMFMAAALGVVSLAASSLRENSR